MKVAASLVIASPLWVPVAAVLAAAGLTALAWSYWRTGRRVGRSVLAMAAALKATALAALALCLIEPLWIGSRAKPGANLFIVLADNSRSMTVRDRAGGPSRGQALRAALADPNLAPARWQLRLAQDFDVRRYLFDRRLRSTRDFQALDFDGTGTRLLDALQTLSRRYQGRPVAGILLFSDGNFTDSAGTAAAVRLPDSLPPIYPVVCGQDRLPTDLALRHVSATQSAFEDAPVVVRADVQATGVGGSTVVAELLDRSGKRLARLSQPCQEPEQTLVFRFDVRPGRSGVLAFQVRTFLEDEGSPSRRPQHSREATLENNAQWLAVNRGSGPYQVLYVSGRPNWEYKFLRRAIEEEPRIRLVALIRVARREPKFVFHPRGGSANPLFRGFDSDQEETERYDEPVLVRLNTKDADELRGGFPKTRAELFRYHAVVLDDVEAAFFTADQLALLRRFVGQRGGGCLMLGGQESFHAGNYTRTPLADVLPVYLDRAGGPASAGSGLRLRLTRDGWLQPWLRLRKTEPDERKRLEEMPPFRTVNAAGAVKPGATVLATVQDVTGRQHPALVAQRYGYGRCAALLIGDLWRWALRQDPPDQDLARAWRQTLRWLVADVPERVQVEAEGLQGDTGHRVRLVTRVRDEQFEPLDNASVTVTVRCPDGEEVSLEAEPSADEPGTFASAFYWRGDGVYVATACATGDGKSAACKAQTGWAVNTRSTEFRSVRPDRQTMARIAERSGGELVSANALGRFVAELPRRRAPVVERWSWPLWHRAPMFLLALGCLVAEWGLRRWKGLA